MTRIEELGIELGEFAFDAVLDDGLLKDAPVVGPIISLVKLAASIPDRIFAKKVTQFLLTVNQIKDPQKTQEFLDEIRTEATKRAHLSEVLILTLDQIDDLKKANFIAFVFMAYVEKQIDLSDLRRFLHSINAAFESDLTDFVQCLVADPKAPHLPIHLGSLIATEFAYGTGGYVSMPAGGQKQKPAPSDLGRKFAHLVVIYRARCRRA